MNAVVESRRKILPFGLGLGMIVRGLATPRHVCSPLHVFATEADTTKLFRQVHDGVVRR